MGESDRAGLEQWAGATFLQPLHTSTTGESSANRAKQTWTGVFEQQGYDSEWNVSFSDLLSPQKKILSASMEQMWNAGIFDDRTTKNSIILRFSKFLWSFLIGTSKDLHTREGNSHIWAHRVVCANQCARYFFNTFSYSKPHKILK